MDDIDGFESVGDMSEIKAEVVNLDWLVDSTIANKILKYSKYPIDLD